MENFQSSLKFLKKISFPRYTKSAGDKKCAEIIIEEFGEISKKLNENTIENKIYEHNFNTSSFYIDTVLNILHPINGILMIIIFALYISSNFMLALILNCILCFVSLISRNIIYHLQFKVHNWGKKIETSNIIFDIKPRQESKQNIVFLAHRDSISHKIAPLPEGIAFFVGYIIAFLYSIHLFIVIIPCIIGVCEIVSLWELIWGVFFGIFTLILLFNKKGNKSKGIIDNGTGVATLYYIAQEISKKALEQTRVILVATGAEELGDYGAYEYIKKYEKDLPKETTKFIVVDSVGTQKKNVCTYGIGYPVKKYSNDLLRITKKVDKEFNSNLVFQTFPPLLQVATDHVPVVEKGYECLIFHSEIFTIFHSERDDWKNFNENHFKSFLEFSKGLVYEIDIDQK